MLLWGGSFPGDRRVEREVVALIEHGWRVTVLCDHFAHARLSPGYKSVMDLVRVVPSGLKPLSRLRKAACYRFLVDPIWILRAKELIQRDCFQVVHIHDLPNALQILRLARSHSVATILDLHENYPAMMMHAGKMRLRKILFSPNRWMHYETQSIVAADHVLVVTEEAKNRIDIAESQSKVTIVSNTPDLGDIYGITSQSLKRQQTKDRLNIVYAGLINGRHRGIETCILSLKDLIACLPSARLLIIGDGNHLARLRQLAWKLHVQDKIEFMGYLPFNKYIQTIADEADICVIPHLKSPHTDTTIPNKLFHYMALGKPVIGSDCKPIMRIIKESSCGITYESGNAREFAEAVMSLKDPATRNYYGRRGRASVEAKYNWSIDKARLLQIYHGLD